MDCECDGGAEIGAGEVCELDWGGSRRCGWRGGEREAMYKPFVVGVRAGGGVGAVEEVSGGVDAEEFGSVGDGFDEKEAVCWRWIGGGVNGEQVASIGRGESAL